MVKGFFVRFHVASKVINNKDANEEGAEAEDKEDGEEKGKVTVNVYRMCEVWRQSHDKHCGRGGEERGGYE